MKARLEPEGALRALASSSPTKHEAAAAKRERLMPSADRLGRDKVSEAGGTLCCVGEEGVEDWDEGPVLSVPCCVEKGGEDWDEGPVL
jgi:hypothetical protein